jgi:hypothetical protein
VKPGAVHQLPSRGFISYPSLGKRCPGSRYAYSLHFEEIRAGVVEVEVT